MCRGAGREGTLKLNSERQGLPSPPNRLKGSTTQMFAS